MRTGRRLPFENAGRPRRAHLGRILQQLILPRGARDWRPEHLSKHIDEKLRRLARCSTGRRSHLGPRALSLRPKVPDFCELVNSTLGSSRLEKQFLLTFHDVFSGFTYAYLPTVSGMSKRKAPAPAEKRAPGERGGARVLVGLSRA